MSQSHLITKGYLDDLVIIKQWLEKQPHLPSNIDDQFLLQCLYNCSRSLEKTKALIDLCYTVRSQASELFTNRDPKSSSIKNAFKILDIVPLPKSTKDNNKLLISRLVDPDPDKFGFVDCMKAYLALADVRLIFEDEFSDGEIAVFDMSGFTLKHVYKFQILMIKKFMVYVQEAHPARLTEIHVINTPPFLDKALATVKPFMKSEVAAKLHFHPPNTTTLYEHVPKELLPEEYGGNVGKIANIKAEWLKKISKHRDFLLDDDRWKIDERRRPSENTNGKQLFGMEGSFRTLEID